MGNVSVHASPKAAGVIQPKAPSPNVRQSMVGGPPEQWIERQQLLGNQGVLRRLSRQPSGGPAQLEREADSVASVVTGTPQVTSTAPDGYPEPERHPAVERALRSPGEPLGRATRAIMEPRFGADLSHVRIHRDVEAAGSAAAIGARAYAFGHDVVFAKGQYQPGTAHGDHLLAHELVHTLQQSRATGIQPRIARSPDPNAKLNRLIWWYRFYVDRAGFTYQDLGGGKGKLTLGHEQVIYIDWYHPRLVREWSSGQSFTTSELDLDTGRFSDTSRYIERKEYDVELSWGERIARSATFSVKFVGGVLICDVGTIGTVGYGSVAACGYGADVATSAYRELQGGDPRTLTNQAATYGLSQLMDKEQAQRIANTAEFTANLLAPFANPAARATAFGEVSRLVGQSGNVANQVLLATRLGAAEAGLAPRVAADAAAIREPAAAVVTSPKAPASPPRIGVDTPDLPTSAPAVDQPAAAPRPAAPTAAPPATTPGPAMRSTSSPGVFIRKAGTRTNPSTSAPAPAAITPASGPMRQPPGGGARTGGTSASHTWTPFSQTPNTPQVEVTPRSSDAFTPEYSSATPAKVDVSNQYRFSTQRANWQTYQRASGRLGKPGEVVTHHDSAAHRATSYHTGDDASHLIGEQFGSPGDVRNLSRGNWVTNRVGNWRGLEDAWAALRRRGVEIDVEVTDVTRDGAVGPYRRNVKWTETWPDERVVEEELDFANTTTGESRAASGQTPAPTAGPGATVIPIRQP